MKDKISKNAYYSAIKSSPIAIIPFGDIFVQNKVVSDYTDIFLKEFGIKQVVDSIDRNEDIENSDHYIMILIGTEKWEKIKELVEGINTNKILEAINLISQNGRSELTKEKIVSFFA
jgi:hypothetical protein